MDMVAMAWLLLLMALSSAAAVVALVVGAAAVVASLEAADDEDVIIMSSSTVAYSEEDADRAAALWTREVERSGAVTLTQAVVESSDEKASKRVAVENLMVETNKRAE
jgi:hypothetical protein